MLNQPKKALERQDFQEIGPASQPRGQPSQPTIQTAIHTGFVGNSWCPNRRRNKSIKTQRKTNSGFGRAGELHFRRASQLANQSANQTASQPSSQPASQPGQPASQSGGRVVVAGYARRVTKRRELAIGGPSWAEACRKCNCKVQDFGPNFSPFSNQS